MAKQRKKKRGINPIRLLIVVAMEFLVILGLLIICVKVFPDNPILAPLFSKKAETPVVVLDAGHGGYDAGSTFEELYEKDVTLAFVWRQTAIRFCIQERVMMYPGRLMK